MCLHPRESHWLILLLALVILGMSISCATSRTVQISPEEIALAQEAVQELLLLSLEGASEREYSILENQTMTTNFIPEEASFLFLHLSHIPGAQRLLEKYLKLMAVAANSVMRELISVFKPIIPTMLIPEPYSLIAGGSNAATTFFVREQGEQLKEEIRVKLLKAMAAPSQDHSANDAWQDLQMLYNTYAIAQNQISLSNLPILSNDPLASSVVSIWNVFLGGMSAQEDLIRATAASFDSPGIALFIIEERN